MTEGSRVVLMVKKTKRLNCFGKMFLFVFAFLFATSEKEKSVNVLLFVLHFTV